MTRMTRMTRMTTRGMTVILCGLALWGAGPAGANDPKGKTCLLQHDQLWQLLEACGQPAVCPPPVCPQPACPRPVCEATSCPGRCPVPVVTVTPAPIGDFRGRCKPKKDAPGMEQCRGTFWRATLPAVE
jgi:hypothetical protein